MLIEQLLSQASRSSCSFLELPVQLMKTECNFLISRTQFMITVSSDGFFVSKKVGTKTVLCNWRGYTRWIEFRSFP
jgi:hypothetical protein